MKFTKDTESLVPSQSFNRRGFMQTAVGATFAAAVLPVSAETINTPDTGLLVGEISIAVGDHKMDAYRAQPKGKTNLPVVLVVSEIFGVHQHIADVCRRFAQQGYLAIAPELFQRQGDPTSFGTIQELMTNLISKVPDAQVIGDLDATVAWANANGGDTNKLAITGFCWGGRITWLYAEHQPKVKAAVAWYGRLTGTASALTPKHPIDLVAQLHAPVLGLYGGQDTGISLESVEQMRQALANVATKNAAAKASTIVVFPDAPHAFNADYRPSYREKDAKEAWVKCLAWFKQYGVA